MKIITNIYFLFLTISILACNNTQDDTIPEVSIKGMELRISSDNIDRYKCPELIINNVVISQMYTRYVSQLTSQEWKESDTLFCLGKGHNEFQFPTLAKGTENSLLILDQPSIGNKLTSLTVIKETDNIEAIKDVSKWEKFSLLELPAFTLGSISFASPSESTILVSGAPYDDIKHIFSMIDYKNQKVTPLKFWPNDGVKCENMVKHSVYATNSQLYGNGKGRFLYQCEWSRYAFLFSIEGKNVNIIKELFSEFPKYSSAEDGRNFVFSKESMSSETLNSTASNDKIFFLLRDSDRKGNKYMKWETPFIYGNTIVEYDWDGNKKRIIYLDHFGQDILLSEDNKTLYLLTADYSDNQTPKIWSYNLSSIK